MTADSRYSQAGRALQIDTELGDDTLLLRAVSGQEAISQLFRFQLDLVSEDDSIGFESIIGTAVTLHLEIVDGERFFHGYISRFSQGPRDGRLTSYQAEMVPWFWFLTRTTDCRIFQNKTTPDIVALIFKDLGFSDYEPRLFNSYRSRDYCVQYRETDFNFVSRLMEEEGIYYFFEHEKGKHTMILMDDAAAQDPCPNQPRASCEATGGGWSPEDSISELRFEEEFRPGAYAHTDFNFETPSTSLMVMLQKKPKWETYDYPGIYPARADGDKLARVRLEEATAFRQHATGKSNCRGFNAGYTVEIRDHYRTDVNQKWLLTAVTFQANMGGSYHSGKGDDGIHYENTFTCIPASTPFRPPRTTPKPHVQGCQTAIVVGPAGEEILTDKYGRVKVQFHWDREGERNENTSCWIRVSSPWAGSGWGGINIPRIGHEVVVDFLEGDPDQPLIIGRVYHAENMPPWKLPAKASVSGFKSNSTKGGHGYNEFSMDDTKGNELIRMHAQCDQDISVEHDERTHVGHDRTETVKRDETITIGRDRTEMVAQDETIRIGRDREESVGLNESVTVAAMRTHTVGLNDMLTVNATQEITVGIAQLVTVGAAQLVDVKGERDIKIGMSQTTSVGKTYTLNAADSIVLKTGDSSIIMKSDGTIDIKGVRVTVRADSYVDVMADKDVYVGGEEHVTVHSARIDLNP